MWSRILIRCAVESLNKAGEFFDEGELLEGPASGLQLVTWNSYFVRISSKTSIARGSPDSPSQNNAFFRSAGSEFDLAI